MKCSLGLSNFLEEISSLSHSVIFLYFFALITEDGFLISPCYSILVVYYKAFLNKLLNLYQFKGLDLIDRVPDELWMEVCDIVQETGIKTIPKKKKCKKAQ